MDFPTARAEGVSNIIHGGKTDGQEVRARTPSQSKFIDSGFGKLGKVSVRIGAGLPLGVEKRVSRSAVRFSAERVRESRAVARGGNCSDGGSRVEIRRSREQRGPGFSIITRDRMGPGILFDERGNREGARSCPGTDRRV